MGKKRSRGRGGSSRAADSLAERSFELWRRGACVGEAADAERALCALEADSAALDAARRSLHSLEDHEAYSRHTRRAWPLRGVSGTLRKRCGAEMATAAWCKLWEVLDSFERSVFLDDEEAAARDDATSPFATLHLCEAPGGFVTALNHFRATRRSDDARRWEWRGSTLRPSPEGFDDRFVRATAESWDEGDDGRGDLLRAETRRGLVRWATDRGGCALVTADGSVDCSGDFGAQERTVLPLLEAEAEVALGAVRKGGTVVMKCFTFFEPRTRALAWSLARRADSLVALKPMLSKGGSGELYLVALGVRCAACDACCDPPPAFVAAVAAMQARFAQRNARTIARNLASFVANERPRDDPRKSARELIEGLRISALLPHQRLVQDEYIDGFYVTQGGASAEQPPTEPPGAEAC